MSGFLLDANILIYAFRADSAHHTICRDWLSEQLQQGIALFAPSVVELALLRITTLAKYTQNPSTPSQVFRFLDALHQGSYRNVEPSTLHRSLLEQTCQNLNLYGNDVNDAYLVALALENNATLVSLDQGFKRFPNLQWLEPA